MLSVLFCLGVISLATGGCSRMEMYSVNEPAWLKSKVDSIAREKQKRQQGDTVVVDITKTIVGAEDFSSGWWADHSQYFKIPAGKLTHFEFIKKINDRYAGQLTEGDRVIVAAMYSKVTKNEKAMNLARTSEPKIFREAQFPKIFDDVAQEGYMEAEEAYTSMFQDAKKYNIMMNVLADIVMREARKDHVTQVMEPETQYGAK